LLFFIQSVNFGCVEEKFVTNSSFPNEKLSKINLFNSSFSRLSNSLSIRSSDVIVDSSLNGETIFANEFFSKEKNIKN
ncbi:hypothetical protein, partial [Cetobacterium sp.]|uniref:hypothetical protein n=1 Tax=Cetobacterium sp. TaxID=2071632 RepID=UPI003F2DEC70